jgi:hypothetical protein
MSEMRVFSAFMGNLNSQANRDSEASTGRESRRLVECRSRFRSGRGPFRVVAPNNYVAWHNTIVIAGIGLDALAQYIRITAEVQDQSAFDLADHISLGCRVVSSIRAGVVPHRFGSIALRSRKLL